MAANIDPGDAQREFWTHLLYLYHFDQLITAERPGKENPQGLVVRLLEEQQPLITAVERVGIADAARHQLRKYLFAAWNFEATGGLSRVHPREVRRFTNQSKPVDAYYALYFQVIATQYVLTGVVSGTHAGAVSYGTHNLAPKLPAPWRLRLHYDRMIPEHFPSPVNLKGVSGWNLTRAIDHHEHVVNFLRRTGELSQHDLWAREYKNKKNKRVPNGPRAGRRYRIIDVPVGRVSFFDVMYRFRVWANYREADTIIEGGEYEEWAVEFDELYNSVVEATAVVTEHAICRRIGGDVLHTLYDEYLAFTKGTLDCAGILRRQDIICAFVK